MTLSHHWGTCRSVGETRQTYTSQLEYIKEYVLSLKFGAVFTAGTRESGETSDGFRIKGHHTGKPGADVLGEEKGTVQADPEVYIRHRRRGGQDHCSVSRF